MNAMLQPMSVKNRLKIMQDQTKKYGGIVTQDYKNEGNIVVDADDTNTFLNYLYHPNYTLLYDYCKYCAIIDKKAYIFDFHEDKDKKFGTCNSKKQNKIKNTNIHHNKIYNNQEKNHHNTNKSNCNNKYTISKTKKTNKNSFNNINSFNTTKNRMKNSNNTTNTYVDNRVYIDNSTTIIKKKKKHKHKDSGFGLGDVLVGAAIGGIVRGLFFSDD